MCHLAEAIYSLGQRDFWDYLAVAAPLVLSAVAIGISIATAKKQNQIALFEIRHKVLYTINSFLLFGESIGSYCCDEAIVDTFISIFGTNIDIPIHDPIDSTCKAVARIYELERDFSAARFVFPKEDFRLVEKIISMERDYIGQVIEDGMIKEQQLTIQNLCKKYRRKYFKKLVKRFHI